MRPQARQEGVGRNHPSEAVLVRFMRGELPPGEAASVVRHLLRGCSRCSAVTREVWSLGDEVAGLGEGTGCRPQARPVEVWL